MKRMLMLVALAGSLLFNANAEDGLVTRASPYSVAETMDRLEAVVRAAGPPVGSVRIFARIDFQQLSGGKIRPNQALLFGSGAALPGLADKHPTVTMDLPLKVLVWEDGAGKAWVSFNSPTFLRARHVVDGSDAQLDRIGNAAKGFIEKALQQP